MADLDLIATRLAERARTVAGLKASPTVVDAVTPPMLLVGDPEIDWDEAFARGMDVIRFRLRLYVSRASERNAQHKLNSYLKGSGATSLKAALEGDRTLGGAAETLHVTGVRGYGAYDVGATTYLGADLLVTVWAKGT